MSLRLGIISLDVYIENNSGLILYTQNNWRVKYLANRSKIVVGVTLIWQKAVAVSKCNSYRPEMASFKFGGLKIICQTAKLNTPPIILCSYTVYFTIDIKFKDIQIIFSI